MIDSIGWVLAAVVAVLVAAARVMGKGRKPPVMPSEPPEQVAATHAREAIEDAAQSKLDDVDDARESDDPAGALADLANRAQRRRTR